MEVSHVYWVGGASAAGKSTVAGRLARRHGFRLYATDDVMGDHLRRSDPAEAPFLHHFAAMGMDERWLDRSPRTMLDTFHWYRGEAFPMILEDLADDSDRGVIAEGFRLLPELVAPLLTDPKRAVWLLPTPRFRKAALRKRGDLWRIAGRTSDPERALRNLLERDALFTERLAATTAELGLQTIPVDGTLNEEELTAEVAAALGLGE